jgi:competence protein ComEC
VGKHFNAFAAEQWLAADGDDRDPPSARDPHARCDRDGCIAALPGDRLLSVVTAPPAYEEDCVRAAILVSALPAPVRCPAQVFDEQKLAQTGAVGLTWNGVQYSVATDRSTLEDRPWSPAPPPAADERRDPPTAERTPGADPADPSVP